LARAGGFLEHDPEKWMPVFRKIMLKQKDSAGG
jgi:hypothetical protein